MMTPSSSLYQRDIISIDHLSLPQINQVLDVANTLKATPHRAHDLLNHKIIANCFYEPSTRTRLSFETAALRLGAKVIGFDSATNTSSQKGETLADAIQIIANYADLVVLRHPLAGAARLAAELTETPIINAGDGSNKHPTQTLLDLFSIQECQGQLNGLHIAFLGDLKHGRTVHSLAKACSLYDCRLYFVAPQRLSLPDDICDYLAQKGIKYSFHQTVEEIMRKLDILYVTRLQKERLDDFNTPVDTTPYRLHAGMLGNAKSSLRILHPLPRVDELDRNIDALEHAYYFQQAANGVFVRQALLHLILNDV